ncbi:hypothetical protein D3C76_534730 [compost metagenome]
MRQIEAAVEQYLVQVWRTSQVLLAQILGIAIQRLVVLHVMAVRVTALQVFTQAVAVDHLPHLRLQVRGVGLQVT